MNKTKTDIKENCPCLKTDCIRHGNCEECRKHHYGKNSLPSCERKP